VKAVAGFDVKKFIQASKKGSFRVVLAPRVGKINSSLWYTPHFITFFSVVFGLDCLKVNDQYCTVRNTVTVIKAGAQNEADIPKVIGKGSFDLMWYAIPCPLTVRALAGLFPVLERGFSCTCLIDLDL
jgi:hypothetical protein